MEAEALQQQLDQLRLQNEDLQRRLQQTPEGPPAAVSRISVKLPPFWRDRPTLWFSQVEAQFSLAGITQEATKYAYVVSHLDEKYANEVDIITSPPAENPYTTLKTALIKRVSLPEDQRIKQLLIDEDIGDRKPSQYLRHLRSLAGPAFGQDKLLRTIWLQRLPINAQAILQTQPATASLDDLAEVADKIVAVQPTPAPAVHAVASKAPPEQLDNQLTELRDLISSMQSELQALRSSQSRDSRSPGPPSQPPVGAAAGCRDVSSRVIIRDRTTNIKYLADCGSDVCCWPKRFLKDNRPRVPFALEAANDSTIATYGTLHVTPDLGLQRKFSWNFLVADVNMPILGSDFLAYYGLLPDCRNKRLIDSTTGRSVAGESSSIHQLSVRVASMPQSTPFSNILAEFPELTKPSGAPRQVRHSTVHHIRTTPGPPVSALPGSSHAKPHQFVFQDLDSCSHAFLRDDAVRKRLQQPYTGPHPVTQRDDKTITILANNAERRVSIDRVKPAYIIQDDAAPGPDSARGASSTSSPPPSTTMDSAGSSAPASNVPSSTSTPAASQSRSRSNQTINNADRPAYTTRYGRRII
ncbi:Cobyric acid synthase [Frankliniella fusca]|uniref:Cobyric acid synthase n=1 Tax=Frankliniella fusca TaxID=407009 RepID=A0AAE1LEC2_9NEOP|nr:Cobyric acid synthase [Frankliniella fusca]